MDRSRKITGVLLILILVQFACSMPAGFSSGGSAQETEIALGIQSTMIAQQQETLNAGNNNNAIATYTPQPTFAIEENTAIPPTETTVPTPTIEPTPDVDLFFANAKILLYEDMRVFADARPMTALNNLGLKYVDTQARMGDFMGKLNSGTNWDLVIMAAESHDLISGDYMDLLVQHLNRDGALVMEIWYVDEIASGKVSNVLHKCGLEFQKDWNRPFNYDPLDYSLYWLDQTNPVLNSPNTVEPLYTSVNYWVGTDSGDLLRLSGGGDATMLAGTFRDRKSEYGTLATCLDGRMVIQTFCTHDYKQSQTVALWENYIMNTLYARFEAIN